MKTVYLLLGSNLGDREQNIITARHQISRHLGKVITASSLYKTAAWGKTDQPDFFNQVIVVNSALTPQEALHYILEIEKNMGRKRKDKWGERTIDIDILLWADLVIHDTSLTIPHPGIPQRRFTLVPLCEVAKDFVHPVTGKTIAELLEACSDLLSVEKLKDPTNS